MKKAKMRQWRSRLSSKVRPDLDSAGSMTYMQTICLSKSVNFENLNLEVVPFQGYHPRQNFVTRWWLNMLLKAITIVYCFQCLQLQFKKKIKIWSCLSDLEALPCLQRLLIKWLPLRLALRRRSEPPACYSLFWGHVTAWPKLYQPQQCSHRLYLQYQNR